MSDVSKDPEIFNLDVDCFYEIFEFLSLHDLTAIGQTCKLMQQVAGQYFRRNYIKAEKFTNDDGIYTVSSGSNRVKISGFNQFINYTSHYHNEIGPLHYIAEHYADFSSINEVYLVCCEINETTVKCLEKILPKIEVVRVRQCSVNGDFYEKLLRFCGNLREIYVQDDVGDIVKERTNPWLLREYPLLETFQLTARNSFKVTDLTGFFKKNRSIRTFLTTSACLWKHRAELMQCETKLDTLEIYDGYHIQAISMQMFCDLLNQLHVRGFYKRLHLNSTGPNQECGEEFVKLKALQSISIMHFSERCGISRLVNLIELTLYDGFNAFDMEILAKNLINLRRLYLDKATVGDILPFIRNSKKLHKIQTNLNDGILDLEQMNAERAKLIDSCRVVIHIPENSFLDTKWTTKHGNIRLSFVEIRRTTSN